MVKKTAPRKGIKKVLPKRPPRPTTTYNLFVREHVARNGRDPNAFRTAGAAWRRLSDADKAAYAARNNAEKNKRIAAVKRWEKLDKATKRPPSAYSLFVQHVWNTDRDRMAALDWRTASRTASDRWRNLSAGERAKYTKQHEDLMARYRAEVNKVANGGTLNPNWMKDPTPEGGNGQDMEEDDDQELEDEEEEGQGAGGAMMEMEDDEQESEDEEDEDEDDN